LSISNDGLRARFRIAGAGRCQTPRPAPPQASWTTKLSRGGIEFSNPARDGGPPASGGNFGRSATLACEGEGSIAALGLRDAEDPARSRVISPVVDHQPADLGKTVYRID